MGTSWADAGSFGHGSALSLQHDLFDHQSGAVSVHDFPSAFHGAGVSEFSRPSVALDAQEQAESVSDCGWSPGTQVAIGEPLVGRALRTNPDFPLAVLQSGTESG